MDSFLKTLADQIKGNIVDHLLGPTTASNHSSVETLSYHRQQLMDDPKYMAIYEDLKKCPSKLSEKKWFFLECSMMKNSSDKGTFFHFYQWNKRCFVCMFFSFFDKKFFNRFLDLGNCFLFKWDSTRKTILRTEKGETHPNAFDGSITTNAIQIMFN